MEETLQFVDHVEQRQLQMMLYGGPTGGPPPAPQTEYILVSAIEATGQAWVEIDAGIDINPAGLTLPSVPLAAWTEPAMNSASDRSAPAILDALGSGLPMLLLQFLLVLALLGAGIFIYMAVPPFRERELLRKGNPAAA